VASDVEFVGERLALRLKLVAVGLGRSVVVFGLGYRLSAIGYRQGG
jgi:hypothetical protein